MPGDSLFQSEDPWSSDCEHAKMAELHLLRDEQPSTVAHTKLGH